MFRNLPDVEKDAFMEMGAAFAADPHPGKIDLGLGIYRDAHGRVPVFGAVKTAEDRLRRSQETKTYLTPLGNGDYNAAMEKLLLGGGHDALGRCCTVQTPGATGALRLAAETWVELATGGRMWVPDPTWGNHVPIFRAAGAQVGVYPYYDRDTGKVSIENMLEALAGTAPGDLVVLHGSCHNPTGADLDDADWIAVAEILDRTGAVPLIDIAYPGFGRGFDADCAGLRELAARLPQLFIVNTCSKNFGLYRDRTGSLSIVGETAGDAGRIVDRAVPVARKTWFTPPDHGAAIVAAILSDAALTSVWQTELRAMCARLGDLRARLASALGEAFDRDMSILGEHRGMFSTLPLTPEQVRGVRDRSGVHMPASGRINVAGLSPDGIAQLARGIADVLGTVREGQLL